MPTLGKQGGRGRSPLAYYQLGSLNVAKSIAAVINGLPDGCNLMLLQAEGANVRWRDDGVKPTATSGMLLVTGLQPYEYMGDFSAITVIGTAAGAVLNVAFYKI
jgi:hypothetical protein